MADGTITARFGVDGSSAKAELASVADVAQASGSTIAQAYSGASAELDGLVEAARDGGRALETSLQPASEAADALLAKYRKLGEQFQYVAQQRASQQSFNAQSAPGLQPSQDADGYQVKSAQQSASVFQDAFKEQEDGAKAAAAAEREAAAAQADLEARTVSLRSAIEPLYSAELKRAAGLREADALLRAGTITEQQHAAAVHLTQSAYDAEAAAATKAGAGLSLIQAEELSHSVRALTDSVISGINPLQALALEAPRVGQALGTHPEGIAGSIAAITRIAAPWAPLIAGAVAIGALGLAAFQYAQSQKQLEDALDGLGRTSGASIEQLNAVAEAQATAGRASAGAARDIETALLTTGRVGAESLAPATEAVLAYADATGTKAKDAVQTLAPAFADPAKGAKDLTDKLGILDSATLAYIQDLDAQGRREEAQKVLADALSGALAHQRDEVGFLGTAVHNLGANWSWVWEQAGKYISLIANKGPLLSQQADLQQRLDSAKHGDAHSFGPGGLPIVEDPKALQTQLDAVNDKLGDQKAVAATTRANQVSTNAGEVIDTLNPVIGKVRELGGELTKLQTSRDQGFFGLDRDQANLATATLDGVKRAYDSLHDAQGRLVSATQLKIKTDEAEVTASKAKTPAEKEAAAVTLERLKQVGQVIDSSSADREATLAGAKARDQAGKSGDGHTKALERESQALEANARGAMASADAYLQSSAAGVRADAERTAATSAAKQGADLRQRTEQQLALTIAQGAESGAKSVAQLEGQTAARMRYDQAVASGQMTSREADQALAREQALRPLLTLQTLAHGQAYDQLTAIIQRYGAALKAANDEETHSKALSAHEVANDNHEDAQEQLRLAALPKNDPARRNAARDAAGRQARRQGDSPSDVSQAGADAARANDDSRAGDQAKFLADASREYRQQNQLLTAQLAIVGMSAGQRAVILAGLREEDTLRQQGVSASSEEGAALIRAAQDQERLTQALQRAQAAQDELHKSGEGLVDMLGQGLTGADKGWSAWLDAGMKAIQDVEQEFLKLALLNPLKNQLFGENLPTLNSAGGVGGFFSSLFGGTAGALTPVTPIGVTPFPTDVTNPFASESISSFLPSIPGFAGGTDDAPPGWHWTGEKGPELERGGGGEQILPHDRSMAVAAPYVAAPTAGGGGVGAGVTIIDNRAHPSAAPAQVTRTPGGGVQIDLRDQGKRAFRGYVQDGSFERDARGATTTVKKRA